MKKNWEYIIELARDYFDDLTTIGNIVDVLEIMKANVKNMDYDPSEYLEMDSWKYEH